MLSITYPDNSVAAYQYNEAGQLRLVAFTDAATGQSRNIVKDFDYAPTGQGKGTTTYGRNVETSTTYDPTTLYRLERIETRAATGTASYAAPEELHRESLSATECELLYQFCSVHPRRLMQLRSRHPTR